MNVTARAVKRALDVALGGAVLVVSIPVQALTALAIVLDDGPPVLFRQARAGREGASFDVVKFRSMCVHDHSAATLGQVGPDHPLVTRVGRVIRRCKLDELPQLWNVAGGTMSLVGPRPALPEQAAAYDAFQRRRLSVRPGMTGWGQVNGGPTLTWDERIVLDVWYVEHWSLRLDIRILVLTLAVIVRGERPQQTSLAVALRHEAEARVGAGSQARS